MMSVCELSISLTCLMMWMSESGNKTRNNKVGWVLWVHGDSGWGLGGPKIHDFRPQNRGPKLCFRGRQVGAFSDFWARHTGTPFIIWPFFVFFRKIDRFRGWCNITPKSCPKFRSSKCHGLCPWSCPNLVGLLSGLLFLGLRLDLLQLRDCLLSLF